MLRVKIDKVGLQLISYFIENGPTTIYRAAMDLSLYFSHAYKKVVKLVDSGLLTGEKVGRSTMYDVTPKGIVLCLAHSCVDAERGMKKLVNKLGLSKISEESIYALFELYATIYEPSAPFSDIYSITAYIIKRCGARLVKCSNFLSSDKLTVANSAITSIIMKLAAMYLGDSCDESCEMDKARQIICATI